MSVILFYYMKNIHADPFKVLYTTGFGFTHSYAGGSDYLAGGHLFTKSFNYSYIQTLMVEYQD